MPWTRPHATQRVRLLAALSSLTQAVVAAHALEREGGPQKRARRVAPEEEGAEDEEERESSEGEYNLDARRRDMPSTPPRDDEYQYAVLSDPGSDESNEFSTDEEQEQQKVLLRRRFDKTEVVGLSKREITRRKNLIRLGRNPFTLKSAKERATEAQALTKRVSRLKAQIQQKEEMIQDGEWVCATWLSITFAA